MSYDALSFRSPHDLASIRRVLVEDGSMSWRGGDNDTWGEYLIAGTLYTGARVRVFMDGERFVVDMTAPTATALDRLRDVVNTRILPRLDVLDVAPHTGWE